MSSCLMALVEKLTEDPTMFHKEYVDVDGENN
jgi:hypothetical protein